MLAFKPGFSGDMRKSAGQMKYAALLKYRQLTWRHRPLPDFIILGAQKCGTTSLYGYLRQHPQLVSSHRKEVHFFDGGLDPEIDTFEKGQTWYRAHFPVKKTVGTPYKTFEASPIYIFNPLAPKRIADLVPEARLVVILRSPTERAISHYFHERKLNREPLSITEALQAEDERLKPVLKSGNYKDERFIHYSYKSRGRYHEQLKRYFNLFPVENIFIIDSRELLAEPRATLGRLFAFLAVDSKFAVKDLNPLNVASNKSEVPPEVRPYLDDYFRIHNQALYELVGKDYAW